MASRITVTNATINKTYTDTSFNLITTADISSNLSTTRFPYSIFSSNVSVATINNENVIIGNAGNTRIVICQFGNAQAGGTISTISNTIALNVAKFPTNLTIGNVNITRYYDVTGETLNISSIANIQSNTSYPIQYVSSNTAVSTISSGNVIIQKVGNTTISANQTQSPFTQTFTQYSLNIYTLVSDYINCAC